MGKDQNTQEQVPTEHQTVAACAYVYLCVAQTMLNQFTLLADISGYNDVG